MYTSSLHTSALVICKNILYAISTSRLCTPVYTKGIIKTFPVSFLWRFHCPSWSIYLLLIFTESSQVGHDQILLYFFNKFRDCNEIMIQYAFSFRINKYMYNIINIIIIYDKYLTDSFWICFSCNHSMAYI